MISYADDASDLDAADLEGFFAGWRPLPSLEARLALLRAADSVVLAREDGRLVGFVAAISDGAYWAYVTMLEVLPSHGARGIGSELMRRTFDRYAGLYGIDLNCDDDVVPFYERLGMRRLNGMVVRNPSALDTMR